MKKIGIVVHHNKVDAQRLALEVADWLNEKDFSPLICDDGVEAFSGSSYLVSCEKLREESDAIIAFGGDGTILRISRLLQGKETPVLGIDFGRFGFLSEVEPGEIYSYLEKLFAGDFSIDERNLLNINLQAYKNQENFLAINELVIGCGGQQRVSNFEILINDRKFANISADGLIIASPTGSTAYALSAGGPIVNPANSSMVLVPICPHTLFNRPIILGPDDTILIKDFSPKDKEIKVSYDGLIAYNGSNLKTIKVEIAKEKLRLISFNNRHFYDLLWKKLNTWS